MGRAWPLQGTRRRGARRRLWGFDKRAFANAPARRATPARFDPMAATPATNGELSGNALVTGGS
ncbi:MAG TPA: hypothetical protein VHS74_17890, partial [Solirubrobacterales bacterium]|nr:hypothetical protein [Solirubrobacterales bacterium]